MAENELHVRLQAPQSQLTTQLQNEQEQEQEQDQVQVQEQVQVHHNIKIISDEFDASIRDSDIPILRPRSSHEIRSVLSPSPLFVEPSRRSKDDIHLAPGPNTPKRPNVPNRGLSLQMPPRDISSTSTANLTKRVPLSPKLDSSITYATPSSVLPRRSRGMDFSRACTNLHHSTLAEQSSPDSSPIIGGRGMMIPRKGLFNPLNIANIPDSPGSVPNSLWSTMASTDKSVISSSVGSANMMDYDSGSTSSDGDDMMGHVEDEDAIHITPQVYRVGSGAANPFGPPIVSAPGGDGIGGFSPAAAKLMSFQRARFNKKERSRKSSIASGYSSMYQGPPSPPVLKSIESSLGGPFFARDPSKEDMDSRRQSLSLGTKDLQLSDCEESDEGTNVGASPNEYNGMPTPLTPSIDERRNVIRRAVTRRGNMLPKSKNFARIRAALQEEGAPVDTEVRREAEVIRQVRESDAEGELSLQLSQPTTTASSPNPHVMAPSQSDVLEYSPEDLTMSSEQSVSRRSSSSTFTSHAMRNSGGLGFWNTFDERMRTPPPIAIPRGSSSGVSDDVSMETPQLSLQSSLQSSTPQQNYTKAQQSIGSHSSTPQTITATVELNRKGNKRMRDDDFDPNYFKRRAVSPGMSLQNSPILPQSPLQRDGGWWGLQPKSNRETPNVQVIGERVSSGGSTSSANGSTGPTKRIGFQGMNDTNDGLMNMSIE